LQGVVAKHVDSRYLPGERQWIKVKKQRTADCVVIGVAGDRTQQQHWSSVYAMLTVTCTTQDAARVSSVIFGHVPVGRFDYAGRHSASG
jgi:ATP-dependent DNA ligase